MPTGWLEPMGWLVRNPSRSAFRTRETRGYSLRCIGHPSSRLSGGVRQQFMRWVEPTRPILLRVAELGSLLQCYREERETYARRGGFLSAVIILFGSAIAFVTLAFILDPRVEMSLGCFPEWFNAFLAVYLIGRLVALSVIWDLRRWGVYLFLLLECVELGMGLFVFTRVLTFPLRLSIAMPSFLILLGVWYWALRLRWRAFR